jgi:PAS domain S-box-containing protein
MIVAGVGFVSLFGWLLELPVLASLGPGNIPVAPSTALLFVLYAGAIFLRTRSRKSNASYWAGVSITAAGALIVAVLLSLSLTGIPWEAEHFGFAVVHQPGEPPAGHMSPVTAVSFLLFSLSYFLSLPPLGDRRGAANLAWWVACCMIAAGSTLVLAYLYGAPMLYGSVFIPPAALTSMAFVALGTALLALAAPQAWLSRPNAASAAHASCTFLLVFVLLAAGIVIAGFLYYRNYERRHRTEVEHQLSAIADLKVDEIANWRKERLGDAKLFYNNSNFSGLVRRCLERPGDKEAEDRLRTWLQHIQKGYRYDRVLLLDARGKERMSVPEARRPLSNHLILRAAEVLHTKQLAFEDFYRNEHDGRVYLAVLIPILDEQGSIPATGTLVLRIDPEQSFYAFLNRWPTPSKTAETLLVRREGNEVLFLNELKFQKNTALKLRSSLDQKELPAAQAVLGRQGIMEGRDYRGVPVIADVRAVPGAPWFLVSRMDISEVYEPMREKLWMMIALVGALLLGAGGGVGLVWRRQRTQFYREKCEAAEALRDSEERLHMLIEGVKDYAIFLLDRDGNVESWNAGAERLKGYHAGEIIGRDYALFFTPEDRESGKPRRLLDEANSQGRVEDEGLRVRKDGSRFWADAVITALQDPGGRPRGFAKITRDVTERRQREKVIEDKNAEMERFIYTVSHDLKSPVVTVKTFLGFLRQDMVSADRERIEKDLDYIRSAADKMGSLLDDLLLMSRVGRVVSEPVLVPFREVVDEALAAVAGGIAGSGVDIRVADAAVMLYADRKRLAEIWQNLIDNAIKYRGGQASPRIEIGVETRGSDTVFFVRDNGMGVDPRHKDKVFGLFEKLDVKSDGTGLGLALVKRIVELYKGKIWLESEGSGKGACFYFTLPEALYEQGGIQR